MSNLQHYKASSSTIVTFIDIPISHTRLTLVHYHRRPSTSRWSSTSGFPSTAGDYGHFGKRFRCPQRAAHVKGIRSLALQCRTCRMERKITSLGHTLLETDKVVSCSGKRSASMYRGAFWPLSLHERCDSVPHIMARFSALSAARASSISV